MSMSLKWRLCDSSGELDYSHDGLSWKRTWESARRGSSGACDVSKEEVLAAMRGHGKTVSTSNEGYWTFRGERVCNPHETLGDELVHQAEYVILTKGADVWGRTYSDDAILEEMAKQEDAARRELAEYKAKELAATLAKLNHKDTKLVFSQFSYCGDVIPCAKWLNKNWHDPIATVNYESTRNVSKIRGTDLGDELLKRIRAAGYVIAGDDDVIAVPVQEQEPAAEPHPPIAPIVDKTLSGIHKVKEIEVECLRLLSLDGNVGRKLNRYIDKLFESGKVDFDIKIDMRGSLWHYAAFMVELVDSVRSSSRPQLDRRIKYDNAFEVVARPSFSKESFSLSICKLIDLEKISVSDSRVYLRSILSHAHTVKAHSVVSDDEFKRISRILINDYDFPTVLDEFTTSSGSKDDERILRELIAGNKNIDVADVPGYVLTLAAAMNPSVDKLIAEYHIKNPTLEG